MMADKQISKYFFASIAAGFVDYSILFSLTEFLKVFYVLSAVFGFCGGITTNYLISVKWVFNKRKFANKSLEFGIYVMTGILMLLIGIISIWIFTEFFNLHYMISKTCGCALVFLASFFIRKNLLFS